MTDKIICKTYNTLTQDCSSKLDIPLATQIMIDGVDVSGCIHIDEWKHCNICQTLIKTIDRGDGKMRSQCMTEGDLRCEFYPNCHYKQLKRTQNQYNAVVEQNKSLQQQLKRKEEKLKMETSVREAKQDIINMLNNKYYNLEEQLQAEQQKVKELEKECKELKRLHIDLAGVKECEIRELKQRKQALEEIKEEMSFVFDNRIHFDLKDVTRCKRILDKISEVLND